MDTLHKLHECGDATKCSQAYQAIHAPNALHLDTPLQVPWKSFANMKPASNHWWQWCWDQNPNRVQSRQPSKMIQQTNSPQHCLVKKLSVLIPNLNVPSNNGMSHITLNTSREHSIYGSVPTIAELFANESVHLCATEWTCIQQLRRGWWRNGEVKFNHLQDDTIRSQKIHFTVNYNHPITIRDNCPTTPFLVHRTADLSYLEEPQQHDQIGSR